MSLIERTETEDSVDFLEVPITAALFGQKKLEVSQDNQLIHDDIQFLQELGPTKTTDLKKGSHARIQSVFRRAANLISSGGTSADKMRPLLEFIAQSYSRAVVVVGGSRKRGQRRLST